MKHILTTALFATFAVLRTSAQTPAVTYADHDKVAAALANGGSLITAPNLIQRATTSPLLAGGAPRKRRTARLASAIGRVDTRAASSAMPGSARR